MTLFGKRIGSLTDPVKNILGSRCPPEVVGFQTNTPQNKQIPYGKLRGLAKGESLKVNFNQGDTMPSA